MHDDNTELAPELAPETTVIVRRFP
jgi:hypothetical protein